MVKIEEWEEKWNERESKTAEEEDKRVGGKVE